MKNISKAGLLIGTLVIPALIFLLLQLFARNHYDLPYIVPETDSLGKVQIQNGDTLFHQVNASEVLGQENALPGKISVLHHLPADCTDSCKLVLSELERVAALTDQIEALQIVTLTENQQKATAHIPTSAGKRWNVKELTSSLIATFFRRELGVTHFPDTVGDIVLIDTEGFARGIYKLTSSEETDRLMAEIKILAYEDKKQ